MLNLDGITEPGDGAFEALNPAFHSSLAFHNRLEIEVHGKEGLKQRVEHVGNILASWGLDRLMEQIISGSDGFGGDGWVSVGVIGTDDTAPASTQDALIAATESVAMSQASMTRQDSGARTAAYLMTFQSNQAYVAKEIGLFGSNVSSASMIARQTFSSVSKAAADTIHATYQIIAANTA